MCKTGRSRRGGRKDNKEITRSEPAYDEEHYRPIGDAGWKHRPGTNTSVKIPTVADTWQNQDNQDNQEEHEKTKKYAKI